MTAIASDGDDMHVALHQIAVVLLGLGLIGSLGACSSFAPEEPPVADSTFIEVLAELHLATARVQIYEDTTLTALQDSIFARYEVSRDRFEQTLTYYSEHPGAYQTLYEAMQDSLDAERTRLQGYP